MKLIKLVLLTFLLSQCADSGTPAETEHHHDGRSAEIALSKRQSDRIRLAYEKPKYRTLAATFLAHGELKVPPTDEMILQSPYPGRVVDVHKFLPDQLLKTGEPLLTIESPDFASDLYQFHSLKSRIQQLEREMERQNVFARENVGSQQALQKAEADLAEAKALYKSLRVRLARTGQEPEKLDPESGEQFQLNTSAPVRLVSTEIKKGAYVDEVDTLYVLRMETHYHAEVMVHEHDLAHVSLGSKAYLFIPSVSEAPFEAEVIANASRIEAQTRSGAVHLHTLADLPENVREQMFVTASFEYDAVRSWSIPNQAVATDGESAFAFIRTSGARESLTFEPVSIQGFDPGKPYTAIDSVYKSADFVVDGAFLLFSEWTKSEAGHDH